MEIKLNFSRTKMITRCTSLHKREKEKTRVRIEPRTSNTEDLSKCINKCSHGHYCKFFYTFGISQRICLRLRSDSITIGIFDPYIFRHSHSHRNHSHFHFHSHGSVLFIPIPWQSRGNPIATGNRIPIPCTSLLLIALAFTSILGE